MQNSINKLKQSLSPLYDSREMKAIIALLFEEVCGLSRLDMLMNPNIVLSEEKSEIMSCYAEMLAEGVPVQQVLGYEYFLGRRFEVNPDVLIPRPETAELVDWIVSEAPIGVNVLDVGTGSGCIAISLAALINNSRVFAYDLSTKALKTAILNAERLNISNVTFVHKDILESQNERFEHPNVDNFDIIVSNPPYIMHKEKSEMSANVLDYEPHLALFVPDSDPLLFYRAIGNYGLKNLRHGGRLYFEINAALGRETCQLLESLGYRDIILRKDLNGLDRMISATL
ncbi:MAG: peptide chain release factor N(5)-glutamine methyltransferase [Bacteroidales bacterium]|nr:peptide chain release factor N(5)-glutamine methyltransferase [Bacteroidales bacterium]